MLFTLSDYKYSFLIPTTALSIKGVRGNQYSDVTWTPWRLISSQEGLFDPQNGNIEVQRYFVRDTYTSQEWFLIKGQ